MFPSGQTLGVLSQDGVMRFVNIHTCKLLFHLGSNEQARDLEKYYGSNPAAVQGKEVSFELSSTFSFLQVRLSVLL